MLVCDFLLPDLLPGSVFWDWKSLAIWHLFFDLIHSTPPTHCLVDQGCWLAVSILPLRSSGSVGAETHVSWWEMGQCRFVQSPVGKPGREQTALLRGADCEAWPPKFHGLQPSRMPRKFQPASSQIFNSFTWTKICVALF